MRHAISHEHARMSLKKKVKSMDFSLNLFPSHYGWIKKEVKPKSRAMGRSVIVVDDDDDFRLFLRDRLERMGIQCFDAENGEVAQLILRKHKIDLIITDNHMPKMDGLELIDWLQKTERDMPVIFVSGDLNSSIREKAEEARVYAMFEKPCSLAELSLKVEEAFNEL
jgi:DNA-binding NtrC family response regulator